MYGKSEGLLGVKDIVFFNIIAILGLRQLSNVALYGASAMVLWVIAAFCLFLPSALICCELSTGWSKNGGIFIWVKTAFGKRIAWIMLICLLSSSVIFFPLMLQFAFNILGYLFRLDPAVDKVLIGIGSIAVFWNITLLNMLGLRWTRRINSLSVWWGIFAPFIVLVSLATIWLASGKPMATDYTITSNWLPDFAHWNTIVFLSTMMSAFAGFEIGPMIAGRVSNPQYTFPRAIAISAAIIVTVYMVGTWAINTLIPSELTNIVVGFMQAVNAGAILLNIPWLVPLMGICMFLGTIGQMNSWLVAPIYMLQEAVKEDHFLGSRFSKLHPRYGTPVFGLFIQAVIVTFLCLSIFIAPNIDAAYWILSALTTLMHFIPYLLMFMAYYWLRIKHSHIERSFKIPGVVLPILLPLLGVGAVIFALMLLFIPPVELNLGSGVAYTATLAGGVVFIIIFAEWLFHRGKKRYAEENQL